jgi:hypothetical protein
MHKRELKLKARVKMRIFKVLKISKPTDARLS